MPKSEDVNQNLINGFCSGGWFFETIATSIARDASMAPVPQAELHSPDQRGMAEALRVAMKAIGWSAPNPSVGCVIMRDEKVLVSGFTQAYRLQHAERMALDLADEKGIDVTGATLFVTLEPCAHHGNQPPCLDRILGSPIARVVIGLQDPDARVSGRSISMLRNAGKEVSVGVLGKECEAWHRPFLKTRKKKLYWAAKWAQTPEGRLADGKGKSKWITGPVLRSYTHWLRQKYDAVLVGAGTYLADSPSLTVRDCAGPHRRNPQRIVWDPRRRLPDSLSGWAVFRAATFGELVEEVENLGLQSVMIEGGSTVLRAGFELNLYDEIHQMIGRGPGVAQFDDGSSLHQLNEWSAEMRGLSVNQKFQKITEMKIDDNDLHEWIPLT